METAEIISLTFEDLKSAAGVMKLDREQAADLFLAVKGYENFDPLRMTVEAEQAKDRIKQLTEEKNGVVEEAIDLRRQLAKVTEQVTFQQEIIADQGKRLVELGAQVEDDRIDAALDGALKAGRIIPRDRDTWRQLLVANFETGSRLLANAPKVIDFRVIGTGAGGAESKYTAEEIAQFHKMGLTDEEIRTYDPDGGRVA